MTRTELLEHYLKPTDLTVKELIDRNAFAQIIQFAEAYRLEQLRIGGVSNSDLIEELRLKLIGMECFADEYYNEDAKAGCKTIFDELKDWIDKKRV